MNCGVVWWVSVSSLKLSDNGLWVGISLCHQSFINSNALLVSLMAVPLVHVDRKNFWPCLHLNIICVQITPLCMFTPIYFSPALIPPPSVCIKSCCAGTRPWVNPVLSCDSVRISLSTTWTPPWAWTSRQKPWWWMVDVWLYNCGILLDRKGRNVFWSNIVIFTPLYPKGGGNGFVFGSVCLCTELKNIIQALGHIFIQGGVWLGHSEIWSWFR